MKINNLVRFSCLSVLTATALALPHPMHAHNHSSRSIVSQASEQAESMDLEATAQKMISLFFEQKFDSFADSVSPKLQTSVAPEKMEKAYQKTIAENGKFLKIIESKSIETPSSNLVVVTLEFEQVTEDWVFIFNDEQQIVGINSPLSSTIQDIANEFINAVIAGDYSTARAFFHPVLKETIFPQEIESSWQNLVNKNGKFEKVVNTKVRKGSTVDGIDFVTVDLGFAKAEEEVLIIFDGSKNIVGVDFVEQ